MWMLSSLQLDPIDDPCAVSVRKRENNTFGLIICVEWNAQYLKLKCKFFSFIHSPCRVFSPPSSFQVTGEILSFPAQVSSTVINGSGPWTRYKMRDFLCSELVCMAARLRMSGPREVLHREPRLRPTRRPRIANAPCLKSPPWCHPALVFQHSPAQTIEAWQTAGIFFWECTINLILELMSCFRILPQKMKHYLRWLPLILHLDGLRPLWPQIYTLDLMKCIH